jgi:hypothetical protein
MGWPIHENGYTSLHIPSTILVLAGSLSLTITLVLAWCLAGMRYLGSGFLKRLFPSYQYLLKSHIDYLLMTGTLLNPFGFLVLAIRPNLRQHPGTPFGAVMTGSFLLTTIGYVGAALYVARAALLAQ